MSDSPAPQTSGSTIPASGSYFVANYPPFSFWSPEHVGEAAAALDRAPNPTTPLGIYLHIPFCRKRCHFCYYKVYTDKNSSEIRAYLDAMALEAELYAGRPFVGGRRPRFVYFGGGTPSYLSPEQLLQLTGALKRHLPWDGIEEVTFECEPGTLTEKKLHAIREMGVTRLSLGVEHFDDAILAGNGRAHGAKEIPRAFDYARHVGFPQINIDLIAGMMGETDETWRACVAKAIALDADSVTIYQMEIPFNTTFYKQMQNEPSEAPAADWDTKRGWLDYAFGEFERSGYSIRSAYTLVKSPATTRFVYTDALWHGADMIGIGVSSFGKINGTHLQNHKDIGRYVSALGERRLPLQRALRMTDEEQLIREFILQLKLGRLATPYFRTKFGVDVRRRFAEPLDRLAGGGSLTIGDDEIRLTRAGLLRVDALLSEFFLPEHRA